MKLNIGSGYLRLPGYIGLDIDLRCEPNIVADIRVMPFPDNTFSFIRAHHIIEHVPDPINAMLEIWRVLKLGGILQLEIPFYPARMAFAPWDHVSFFTPDSFLLLFNPRNYQPKLQPQDLLSKFISVGKMEIKTGRKEFLSEEMNMGLGDITGRMWLAKITSDYWRLRNVHKNIKTQVYGCFYCQGKLRKIATNKKQCPKCAEVYVWDIPTNCVSENERCFRSVT